ncbi:hypothetical protein F5B22DRAFT_610166 [Xylaria bambusicola]|uniref:uncharacterized protein n=1 Tax=Xylaria bambusicola TaxID=326684 RepID=UPI0020082040|nr:uncharacterized protein F5B22DRAFT_610166 [Xylaria bambusicola]KAI0514614.1 hypothetical protein F5B22DRAFT_610166 [Xylaria bambusicola]
MVQRKLDYYFQRRSIEPKISSSSSCTLSFLDFPYHVRHRIYVLAGLVRFCPINLNQEGPRSRICISINDEPSDYACFFESRKFLGRLYTIDCIPGCYCPPFPFALLCVSRAISEEALRILYSENSFTTSRSDSWGLKPLQNLSPSTLSCLRTLTIRLNTCQCFYRQRFIFLENHQNVDSQPLFQCHPWCQQYGHHDRPLRSRARQHATLLQEWKAVVNRLAIHCHLELLRLDLVCDTEDIETAHHVIDSLSPIQNLRACSIRLSQKPSWEHSALAQRAVSRLLGRLPEQLPQNKLNTYHLPAEILIRILEYSELVAPFDLEWSPDRGLVPFDCCKECTETLDCCTCSHYHGSYSGSCTCWRMPLSILLVSRQVNDIAKTIFFQRNRFIVLPRGGRLNDMLSCEDECPPLIQMFQRLPPDTTFLLRSIGLVFPSPPSEIDSPFANVLGKWEETVRLLAAACDTQKLSLALFIGPEYLNRECKWELSRRPSSPSLQALTVRLREVQGLQDLFIYIKWPKYTAWDGSVRYSAALEKEVLGPGYDSKIRGKWIHVARLWYDGETREGRSVFAPDGRRIWPRPYHEDAYGLLHVRQIYTHA